MTGLSGPTPKQAKFLCLLDVLEALFGGSAGGGKSDCLFMRGLMFVDVPGYAGIIFRRSYADLNKPGALIDRSHAWLGDTAARWDSINHTWHFPSGAKLAFGFLENDRDVYHHQSAEYQYIGFDEITQFTQFQYTYMISRARRLESAKWVPIAIRGASNPPTKAGGVVHGEWVKAYFLPWFTCHRCGAKFQTEHLDQQVCLECGATDGEVKYNKDPETGEPRVFVPASLADNPFVDSVAYRKSLQRLDPVTREQLLAGNWRINPLGNKFQRGWFEIVNDYPRDARPLRFWDKAASKPKPGKDPDWTVGSKVITKNGQYWVIDLLRFQDTSKVVEDTIKQTAKLDGIGVDIYIEQEPGSAGVDDITHFREVLAGYPCRAFRSTGPKELYAEPVAAAAEAGNVKLLRGRWNADFLDEFESFPEGAHDDIVDATSKGIHLLSMNMVSDGVGIAFTRPKPPINPRDFEEFMR